MTVPTIHSMEPVTQEVPLDSPVDTHARRTAEELPITASGQFSRQSFTTTAAAPLSHNASSIICCIRGSLIVIILALLFVIGSILSEGEAYTTGLLDLNVPVAPIHATAKTDHSRASFSEELASVKKILYIVTSSSQVNNKRKSHMAHHDNDRLKSLIIPVLRESIESIMSAGFQVDLYLVLSYNLTPERQELVRASLPTGVNVEVWNDATPIDYDDGYRNRPKPLTVKEINRALARQHRFVVRDKLFDYDLFASFEDDMLVTGTHIQHHLYLSQLIEDTQMQAPETVKAKQYGIPSDEIWFGDMAKKQFPRMRPGFIRVEVLLDEKIAPPQADEDIENVPMDYNFSDLGYAEMQTLDPSICCHVAGHIGVNGTTAPMTPDVSQLMVWETGISGFAVREMPDRSWVGLLPGPRKAIDQVFDYGVGKFFPDHTRTLKTIPHNSNPKFLAQSAGWIMTRKQVLEMHMDLCQGSFLPPFDLPTFSKDGLYMMNVEYWSGGLQMWCPNRGCNIQRVVQLDPKNFSKHLLYHTSNNKQKQIARNRRVRVHHLIGQLNTLRKDAMSAKEKLMKSMKK